MRIATSEISLLYEQLEKLRREKHQEEAEFVRNERQRDEKIEELLREKAQLLQTKSELEDQTTKQSVDLKSARSEIAKLEASLFGAKSDVDKLEQKECLRQASEKELTNVRNEILLQGELIRKYREALDKPVVGGAEYENLYKESFKHQIEGKLA